MSRIGLLPIQIPAGVELTINGNVVKVKGPKGEMSRSVSKGLNITVNDGVVNVSRENETKSLRALHGLERSLIANMIHGVTEGYARELEIIGTGYRAAKQGKKLTLNLGFSHPIELEDPTGIETEVPGPNKIIVKGCDKQLVGQYAAHLRSYRKPEPYKGKGVKYVEEHIRRKVGKTGK